MSNIEASEAWDQTAEALYERAAEPPDDLADQLRSLPPRPCPRGELARDHLIARIFTVLFNTRHYDQARTFESTLGLRTKINDKIARRGTLTDPADWDTLFGLAVVDTQRGGDPERGRASFIRLRQILPEGHHLVAACLDGEANARRLIGQQLETREPERPRGLLSKLGLPGLSRPKRKIEFSDFTTTTENDILLPWLDRASVDESKLTPEQAAWRKDGVVILRNFLPEPLVDAYVVRRRQLANPAGWISPTSYIHVPEMRDLALYPPLMEMQRNLIGEDMMLHLSLSGWISTERDWHQDDYLNPAEVRTWYDAVWMALDTIDPDSGPFEYIPGSHRWPLMRGDKVRALLSKEELTRREGPQAINHWASYAERFVSPAIEAEIARRGERTQTFLGNKGDVLIWHARLMHRGSAPKRPNLERRSLIAHYSGVTHRRDMPSRSKDQNSQTYALFDTPLH